MMQTTILLVDDSAKLRKGLRVLIELEHGLEVIGEAGDGQQAIEQMHVHSPDVVVMDINMPSINGIEATRQIMLEFPTAKILALSIHSGKTYVEEMLEAGAAGYLLKESAPKQLITAIQTLKDGKGYVSTDIANIVLSRFRQTSGRNRSLDDKSTERHLSTKLRKPRLPAGMVSRQKLLKRLELDHNKKVTLIEAASGYGKSLLISDWLERCALPSCWLSLDSSDNVLQQFLESMIASLQGIFPDSCSNLQDCIDQANLPPVTMLVGALVADLERFSAPFILVLDDMHQITEKDVYDMLSQIVSHPFRMMHLVLISRMDPVLPLTTLRALDDLHEIRADDLRFSLDEVRQFLEQGIGETIDPEVAVTWLERTDGWVTGLQLATHNRGGIDDTVQERIGDKSDNWRKLMTNREYDVLLLLEQRLSYKEIADRLSISTETVKFHLKNIYSKLNATDRRDAIVKAEQLGVLE